MISLDLAVNLKNAGLRWEPKTNDFFAIPDRGLDERIFVLNEVMSNLDEIQGELAVTFQGAPEWALDYLITSEIVWLPRESQIREALISLIEEHKMAKPNPNPHPQLLLTLLAGTQTCTVEIAGIGHNFSSPSAAEAYSQAYLYLKARTHEKNIPDLPAGSWG